MTTLCLNLIVKNESAIVERLIASMAPYISYYVVCDTGSTDDTISLVQEGFARRGVPGEIHQITFRNFSEARNQALVLGRKSHGAFDYFLLADADMELVVKNPAFTDDLDASAYVVRQRSGSLSYYNARLLRRDASASYVGPTHEYLAVQGESKRMSEIEFLDHACGANRGEKAARDIKLLSQALRENPLDARAMFYLAQTYREVGRYEEAALWYEARILAEGFREETWYARYQLAMCCSQLGDEAEFVEECLRAREERPWRAEPLQALANFYRDNGNTELAARYADEAARIPYPVDDILLVDEKIYRIESAK